MEVRLDKWLWAARFFKTRSMTKAAIEGGKVHIDGQKAKPSKNLSIGMVLTIKQGLEKKTVIIKSLSDQRRSATEAALLYEETEDSLQKREDLKEANRFMPKFESEGRPNKKQRRQLLKFKTMK
ncbi:MAG: RNA-binding domain protein [Gammaproteobacteria bacterium]|jgi:ribosome-associated heat shock protein Hsp15|nr:RNA-binding domain protein [Gammaproteobacteria bacterium]